MPNRFVAHRFFPPLTVLLAVAWAGTAAAQGGTATVSGQVTDSTARAPLAGVEILITADVGGVPLRTVRTNAEGRYSIAAVTAGTFTVNARLVGFAPKALRITTRDGETTTADFALAQRTTQLDQVVITGTGGVTQRRAVGNVIETIDAKTVLEVAPARSVDQLIGSRTPGLISLPTSGQIGTGPQIRVRAASSLSLSNDPIVVIDGVRMDAAASRGPGQRGGFGASRLNDISPEDIESIEVIKGPAAATLYGTEASNGVIQIITKRGQSGKTQFTFTTRQGTNWLQNPEGRAGMLYAPNPAGGEPLGFNLYLHEKENGKGPIFQTGHTQGYQGSVTGGTDASRYYVSATYDDDVGVVSWNWDKKFSGRANLDVLATDKLRFQGSLGHIRDRIRLAQNDINTDPFSQLVWGTPRLKDGVTRGFANTPPEEWTMIEGRANNDRTTLSFQSDYNPLSWMTHRLVAGLDLNSEQGSLLYPRMPLGGQDPLGNLGNGQKTANRTTRSFITLDYSGSAKYDLGEAYKFTTSIGLQHYRSDVSTIGASAVTFPAEPITLISNGTTTTGNEAFTGNASVGMFVQQTAAWNNRLFLTAALRGDDNSTFGKDYKAAYYPKFSVSWVASEEPWFKLPSFIGDLRLRGALGAAGTQPATFAAARLYQSTTGYLDQPGLIPDSYGNPELKPERSQELELGFESTVLDGRIDMSYTYYRRNITDAIVNKPIPPSIGFPGNQVVNIGKVKGWGNEFSLNARVFQGRYVGWELGTQLARNGNRIDDMGGAEFFTVGGGGQAQNRLGFGIADFFMYKVRKPVLTSAGAADLNASICDGGRGKGGVEAGGPDVPCATAPRVYWGHSQPIWQMGYNTTVTVMNRLRLYARVDGNGGHYQSNTEVRALHNQGSTLGVINKDPLLAVYRAIEADAPGTYRASFLRLRELSATYTVQPSIIRRIGASSASLSVAGRNLRMLWTQQDGWGTSRDGLIKIPIADQHVWDPEIRAVGQLSNGFQTILPPTASFTTTLRLTF
jgi:TonB-linked SusC/RagA family outer membrane protein